MQTANSLIYIFTYVIFFGFNWVCRIRGTNRLIDDNGLFTAKPQRLISNHIIGVIWLGIIPVILLRHSIIKILTSNKIPDIFFVFLFLLIFMLLIATSFKQSAAKFDKKQASHESFIHLSLSFFISYFIIRASFLFAYELWFRGLLLFDCIHWFGIPTAVFINVSLYVLLHIVNSKKELLACVPFGLLVCFFSIVFNSAWPAIILHIGFSFVYEHNFYRLNLINAKTTKS